MPLPGAGKKPYRMLSIPDMALLGAAALMFFGPEQLPKVARKVGLLVRDVQNTSQSFIREMERAADEHDVPHHGGASNGTTYPPPSYAPPYAPPAYEAPAYEPAAEAPARDGEQPKLSAADEYGIPDSRPG